MTAKLTGTVSLISLKISKTTSLLAPISWWTREEPQTTGQLNQYLKANNCGRSSKCRTRTCKNPWQLKLGQKGCNRRTTKSLAIVHHQSNITTWAVAAIVHRLSLETDASCQLLPYLNLNQLLRVPESKAIEKKTLLPSSIKTKRVKDKVITTSETTRNFRVCLDFTQIWVHQSVVARELKEPLLLDQITAKTLCICMANQYSLLGRDKTWFMARYKSMLKLKTQRRSFVMGESLLPWCKMTTILKITTTTSRSRVTPMPCHISIRLWLHLAGWTNRGQCQQRKALRTLLD